MTATNGMVPVHAFLIAILFCAAGPGSVGAVAAEGGKKVKGEFCSYPKEEAELRKLLSPEQFRIARENGTEMPFKNAYWDNHKAGIYVDVVSGDPLFSSVDKFDSGTGWPSFTKPIEGERVVSKVDATHGMERTEVRSKEADSHLGHVFDDGPGPGGKRFCINSASLKFIPLEEMAAKGYGTWLTLFKK